MSIFGPEFRLLGQILVRRHQYDEAVPHLKIGLNGSPLALPQLHSLLAKCYAAQGAYAQALEELKPALRADMMGTFHYQMYQIYQKLGDQKSAAAALHKSEQLRREKLEAEQRQRLPGGALKFAATMFAVPASQTLLPLPGSPAFIDPSDWRVQSEGSFATTTA